MVPLVGGATVERSENTSLGRNASSSGSRCFRPRLRYPYYDEYGRGRILYGYGGPQLFRYTSYNPLEGIY